MRPKTSVVKFLACWSVMNLVLAWFRMGIGGLYLVRNLVGIGCGGGELEGLLP